MGGASAFGGTASTLVATAGTVQITQVDNKFTGPDNSTSLRADLTGDEMDDLLNLQSTAFHTSHLTGVMTDVLAITYQAQATCSTPGMTDIRLGFATGYRRITSSGNGLTTFARYFASAGGDTSLSSGFKVSANGLIPITFTDSMINGGVTTNGFLDVRASNTSFTEHVVEILRLVFDDESTAQPTGVIAGDTDPEWAPDTATPPAQPDLFLQTSALKSQLVRKIKKLKKKQTKARKSGNSRKARAFAKKLKKLKKQVKTL